MKNKYLGSAFSTWLCDSLNDLSHEADRMDRKLMVAIEALTFYSEREEDIIAKRALEDMKGINNELPTTQSRELSPRTET